MRRGSVDEVATTATLRLRLSPGQDLAALEDAIAAEGRRAARELYIAVLGHLDETLVKMEGGARQRRENRWLSTIVGRLRISRYRVKQGEQSHHPLDRALGLSRSEASPALRRFIRSLARHLSHRRVVEVVLLATGEVVSPQTVLRVIRGRD